MKVLVVPQHSKIEQALSRNTFSDLCSIFPTNIREVGGNESPNWGSAWYIPDENGKPVLYKEDWDTSN